CSARPPALAAWQQPVLHLVRKDTRMTGRLPVESIRPAPPPGDDKLQRLKTQLHQQLITHLNLSAIGTVTDDELRTEVRRVAEELCQRGAELLSRAERDRLVTELLDETFGLGPLEPLLAGPAVTGILINGHGTVYVEREGQLQRAPISFVNERHLLHIVQRIVAKVGRRVDETTPMVDARLPDGSRINAIIPPLALDGSLVSIRRFGVRPLL